MTKQTINQKLSLNDLISQRQKNRDKRQAIYDKEDELNCLIEEASQKEARRYLSKINGTSWELRLTHQKYNNYAMDKSLCFELIPTGKTSNEMGSMKNALFIDNPRHIEVEGIKLGYVNSRCDFHILADDTVKLKRFIVKRKLKVSLDDRTKKIMDLCETIERKP